MTFMRRGPSFTLLAVDQCIHFTKTIADLYSKDPRPMTTNKELLAKYPIKLVYYCGMYAWLKVQAHYGEHVTLEDFHSDAQLRKAVSRDVCRVFEGWDACMLHDAWRKAKRATVPYPFEGIKHPTMQRWQFLSDEDRKGFELFVETVKDRKRAYEEAQKMKAQLDRETSHLRGPTEPLHRAVDRLIGYLETSAKAIDAECLKYCVDVTGNTFTVFLNSIGINNTVLNYEHLVSRLLSEELTRAEFQRVVFGDTPLGKVRSPADVFFCTVIAARQAFELRRAAPQPSARQQWTLRFGKPVL